VVYTEKMVYTAYIHHPIAVDTEHRYVFT